MHKKCLWGGLLLLLSGTLPAQEVMSEGYRRMWNDSVQQAIDQNIEKHRKADAMIVLKNAEAGTEVRVEQVTSDFLFGSNIFLYGQLDTPQKNQRYEDAFGTLFNQATIAFYWKTLEPEMKGHAIIYGIRRWGHPTWISEERKEMEREFETHIKTLAKRYGNRIQNWDVVNECYDQANRGIMPDDYTYKSYRWAMKYFPKEVTFNTNECDMHWGSNKRYVEIVRDLIERGAKIDNCGVQMHIFDPNEAVQIAEGKSDILSPKKLWATLNCLMETGRPTFISEVTISAPDDTEYGRAVQRELTRDFYRLWFSHPNVRGITWWNLIDGGAAPGEPSFSGLLDKEGNPKPSYEILDKLINHEWKTRLNLKADMDGKISFRGFRGTYRITYMNRKGKKVTMQYKL